MIEKTLSFVAEAIGGNLVVCDDGYVIESYISGLRADYIFGEDGEFEKVEMKNLKVYMDKEHKFKAEIID